jgi:hypothetical protein
MDDPIAHPPHYTSRGVTCPSCGHDIECIDVTKRFGFILGNVIKYVWRAGDKGDAKTDLLKAKQYLEFELKEMP